MAERSKEPDTALVEERGRSEKVRHFINLDKYDKYPFSNLPRSYEKAVKKYGKRKVQAEGTLPWTIDTLQRQLTRSMREMDWETVKLQAAYLSHYVADGFQPLHATRNYDGQLTGNDGIHHALEIDIVDRYLTDAPWKVTAELDPAAYIDDPLEYSFDFIIDSFVWTDNILRADTRAKRASRGDPERYYAALNQYAGWIVQRRLAEASHAVAGFWYTAWVNAGRPPMP